MSVQATSAPTRHDVGEPSEMLDYFKKEQYERFFVIASSLADAGDPEALFLLGKAYHFGLGTEVDLVKANDYYNRAAIRGSAKAFNNLGMMELDGEQVSGVDKRHAAWYFANAVMLGLRRPALLNYAETHWELCNGGSSGRVEIHCMFAATTYFSLWRESGDASMLDRAVSTLSYLCLYERGWSQMVGRKAEPSSCGYAMEMAELGASEELANSAYNRGILDAEIGHYESALPWLQSAHEHGLGLASYQLGLMHEKGRGVPKDLKVALRFYNAGAVRGEPQAISRMVAYWSRRISHSFDEDLLYLAIERLAALDPESGTRKIAMHRLKIVETLRENEFHFSRLSRKAYSEVDPRYCSNYEQGTDWSLYLISNPDQTEAPASMLKQIAEGVLGADQCMSLSPEAFDRLAALMSAGQSPMLRVGGARFLLTLTRTASGQLGLGVGVDIRENHWDPVVTPFYE